MATRRWIQLAGGSGAAFASGFRSKLERRDHVTALLAALPALAAYALTAAPTVTGEDSGELAAAASTLGIPHPPGYPLYAIVGKLFLTLIPFGEVAWRLNLLSGLLGAAAVGLAVSLALRLGARRLPALAAGLLIAFSPQLWSQATIAEVYTLAAVVFLGLLHGTMFYLLEPSPRRLFALAWLSGLALTAHPALVLALPGVFFAVLRRDPRIFRRPGEMLAAAAFLLLGFSIYLYLPIRSLANPALDWGDPETLSGFFAHLFRSQYAGLAEPPAHPILDRLLYFGHVALFEVGPVLLALTALGLGPLFLFPGPGDWPGERLRARSAFRAAYLFWLLLSSAGLLFFLTISFERHTLSLNRVFFIPLLLLLVPPAGLGLSRLAAWLESRRGLEPVPKIHSGSGRLQRRHAVLGLLALFLRLIRLRRPALPGAFSLGLGPRSDFRDRLLPGKPWLAAAGLLALPLVSLGWNFSAENKSGYTLARDYARAILATLPQGSIYIPGSDHANFPVLYLQLVEGLRPDVLLADKYGYLDPALLKRIARDEAAYREARSLPRAEAERWLIDRSGRPVFTNSKRSIRDLSPERFQPVGILYRIDRERAALDPGAEEALWAAYGFRNLDSGDFLSEAGRDVAAELIAADILFLRAEYHFSRGSVPSAKRALSRLGEIAGGFKEILQNAATLLAEKGCLEEAVEHYEAALRIAPNYAACRRNLAWTLLQAGIETERAIEAAEKSITELPAEAWFLEKLGDAYRRMDRFQNAHDAYMAAARADPADWRSPRRAGEVLEEDLKSPALARAHYEASLKRRPTQPDLIEKLYGAVARQRYEEEAARALEAMGAGRAPEPFHLTRNGEPGGLSPSRE